MSYSVAGKAVIVTGGTRGIGGGIATVFAQGGARVLIVGRDEEAGEAMVSQLNAAGGDTSFFASDVSTRVGCYAFAEEALRRLGGIDVLCANAGIFPEKRLSEMTDEDFDLVINTNLRSSFFSVQACTDALSVSGQGRVVLTSSITGPITGFPGWTHYAASKAGQLGFMRTAALELAKFRITVNAVLPGNILTEGLASMGNDYVSSMTASIPLGRLGTANDIGYAALFLASEEAGFITGQTITVDGGQTLPESLEALKG
jgi:3-oxoacyl-[acyl-carrier protein] reductase